MISTLQAVYIKRISSNRANAKLAIWSNLKRVETLGQSSGTETLLNTQRYSYYTKINKKHRSLDCTNFRQYWCCHLANTTDSVRNRKIWIQILNLIATKMLLLGPLFKFPQNFTQIGS